MKRVLVTGGAGFIGRHTIRLLEEKGYDVTALDWDLMRMRDLKCLHKITGDMKDKPLMDALMCEYEIEGIIHLGAQSAVPVSMAAWGLDAEQNVMGTISVVDAARSITLRRNRVKRIVYASSGGTVYGNPAKFPVGEDAPLDPQSPYGISKLAGEFYVRISGISRAVLRYPNVYGPGQPADGAAGVVAIFIGRMMLDEQCIIYGDGHQARDYVFVEDIARANVMALEADKDGIYNIGSGGPITVNEIHRIISAQMGKYISPKYEDTRQGDVRTSFLDANRFRDQIGWEPTVTLEEGIKRTIEHLSRAGQADKSPLSCGGGPSSTLGPVTVRNN